MFKFPENINEIVEIPILLHEKVLLPFMTLDISIKHPKNLQLVSDIEFGDRYLGMMWRKLRKPETNLPSVGDIGCIGEITENDGNGKLKIEGLARFRVTEFVATDNPYPVAKITLFEEEAGEIEMEEEDALRELTNETFLKLKQGIGIWFKNLGLKSNFPEIQPNPFPASFLNGQLFSFGQEELYEMQKMTSARQRLEYALEWMTGFVKSAQNVANKQKFLVPYKDLSKNPKLN
ncbi:MAG: LON peptidase substrate-binding domain-containing protein [Pyrinomonadaceae bacterium]|nr:LON peptidase substrate-binding domain-containing protein [Pyrinomonadaceae bacterium]